MEETSADSGKNSYRYGPCFSGDTLIKMADGSAQRADTVRKGSVILTGLHHTPARVRCVLETSGENMAVVRLRGCGKETVLAHQQQMQLGSYGFLSSNAVQYSNATNFDDVDPTASASTIAATASPALSDSDTEGVPTEFLDTPSTSAASLDFPELTGSFAITPWHPIYDSLTNKWVFPRDVAMASKNGCQGEDHLYGPAPHVRSFSVVTAVEPTNTVYNFLLDEEVKDKTMLVGGLAQGNCEVGDRC